MAQKKFQIVAIVAAVALLGTLSLTVFATGSGATEQEDDLPGQLHRLAQRLHGGGHHPHPLGQLIDQLELTPDQLRQLERIHERIGAYGGDGSAGLLELHETLVGQFERGPIEADEVRRLIDKHVEQVREMAYAVTDDLIALVNGLDATQREIVLAHVQGIHEGSDDQRH